MPKSSLKNSPQVPPAAIVTTLVAVLAVIVGLFVYGSTPHGKEPMPPAGPYDNLKPGQISTMPGAKPFVPGAPVAATDTPAPPGLGPPPALTSANGQRQPEASGPSAPGQ